MGKHRKILVCSFSWIYKVIRKGQEDSFCMKNVENIGILWPNKYTEAIRKCQFRITQGDINTVQEKDIHAILPCPVLRRGVYGFKKDVDADLF